MEYESQIQKRIRLLLNAPGTGTRVWRNNVGGAKINGRWVTWGLAPGSGDLIGLRTITVTPEMVGMQIGQFLSAEIKRGKDGVISDDQRRWAETIERFGGIARFFRSPEEAEAFLAGKG